MGSSRVVLVLGGGGRENALCWRLLQDEGVAGVHVAPGNAGTACLQGVQHADLPNISDGPAVAKWCQQNSVSLVVVGPEDPLANGVADALGAAGIACFGPTKAAARIESDKDWAKAFMDRHQVPTARWNSFQDAAEAKNFIKTASFNALVVKASGLAAGKGVVVAADAQEACAAVDEMLTMRKFGQASETLVIEELLEGPEVSVLAFCDGSTFRVMLPAQDHKRLRDGDLGPNTGGMGAYCPCPLLSEADMRHVEEAVFQRTVDGFRREGIKFVGVLYAGLMLTKDGPKVLEFNCRFGDPETEVILPLLESSLCDVLLSCCNSTLHKQQLRWKQDTYAVGVVMASRGYPSTSSKGQPIEGITDAVAGSRDRLVFHCGTALNEQQPEQPLTAGGRVLICVAMAPQLLQAAVLATKMCRRVRFEGAQFRSDIAFKGIPRAILSSGRMTYKTSGVDIAAGDSLVSLIKPLCKATSRAGVQGAIGGFGGLFDVAAAGFKDPILVSGTDGVGTKLKIAQECGIHDTIGIDLVAMCVNDVLAHGAEPLFFLDYYACGELDVAVAGQVVAGVAKGCALAGCALIGGETAEMPGMYAAGEYDVAGFAVGGVERRQMMPRSDDICAGDAVLCLPSSGVHSNGFSLVRRVLAGAGCRYRDRAPFSATGRSLGEELLRPTAVYVPALLPAIRAGRVKAFAHITGGGLTENVPRVVPPKLAVRLDATGWSVPPVFGWLAAVGEISEAEMLRTFNCGVGGIIIVAKEDAEEVLRLVGNNSRIVGSVVDRQDSGPQVIIDNFGAAIEGVMRPYVPGVVQRALAVKRRIAVLISGTGTNLQALIDATLDPQQNICGEIVLVLSNKAGVEGLQRAQRAGIPTQVMKHTDYKSREAFDAAMIDELERTGVDVVCLAGFMRILSRGFVQHFRGRLINIHPALLPSFKGVDGVRQAFEAGVRLAGCTVHFVEEDVDAGAILVQEAVQVLPGDSLESLTKRVRAAELRSFPKALKMLVNGDVRLGSDNRIEWLTK